MIVSAASGDCKSSAKSFSPPLRRRLLAWYGQRRRDLPWRRTRDPYAIFVSEVMLQQTRIQTAIPYYERFLARFPTVTALARAREADVLKAWEGLGYYRRARALRAAARVCVERFGGRIPDDPELFRGLPGVGAYTAGAVLSIAFGRRLPAVDGNVARVLCRLFRIEEDVTTAAARRRLEALARELVPETRPGDWNQALMELGATTCVAGPAARCGACPIAGACAARAAGVVSRLPVRGAGKARRSVDIAAAALRCRLAGEDRWLVERRPRDGLLGGLWQLPSVEVQARPPGSAQPSAAPPTPLAQALRERYGLSVVVGRELAEVGHVFTHLVWHVRAYACRLAGRSRPSARPAALRFASRAELERLAFPAVYRKLLNALGAGDGTRGL